jgi:hypothetical protein
MGGTTEHTFSDKMATDPYYNADREAAGQYRDTSANTMDDNTYDDTTQEHTSSITTSEQYVTQKDGEIHVRQSSSGDGTVERHVEKTEDGISASQQVTHTEKTTTDDSMTDAEPEEADNGAVQPDLDDGQENGDGDVDGNRQVGDNTTDMPDDAVTDNATLPDTDPDNMTDVPENVTDGVDIPENGTDDIDGVPGNGVTNASDTVTELNGTIDDGSIPDAAVVDLTPRSGARILGDRYQTPPAETAPDPQVQRQLSLRGRIKLFLQGIIDSVRTWFARAGTL